MRVVSEPAEGHESLIMVRPSGQLDAVGANQIWDSASPKLSEATPSVLLDMSKVTFMSSAGVGILIRLLTRIGQLGGAMAIYGCSSRVATVLRVVNLEKILNVRETEEEALARLEELGVT